MDLFEHRLRQLHTRSVEKIMRQSVSQFRESRTSKMHQTKSQNISSYMRRFDIERENLNLAKRIVECESSHSRMKYAREWKKNQNYLKVRSKFKRNLATDEPKIVKYQPILGKGSLLVSLTLQKIIPANCQINEKSMYSLKISSGHRQLVPSNTFFTLQSLKGHKFSFYIPQFMRKKAISCKIFQIIENEAYEKGKFAISISGETYQQADIISKSGRNYGIICFDVDTRAGANKPPSESL